MTSKISFFLLFVSAFFCSKTLLAQSISVVVVNSSGANIKVMQGQNPGKGSVVGQLAAGANTTVASTRGRHLSFMAGQKMVGSLKVKNQPGQSFTVTNAMVRAVNPGAVSGNPSGGGNQKGAKKNKNRQSGGAVAVAGDTGSEVTNAEAQQFMKAHDNARQAVGVGAAQWSPQLAKWAQQQADRIAQSGDFAHTPNAPYGENLGIGTGDYSPVDAANRWIAEKQHFRRGDAPVISGGRVTGHYTQVVWRESTQVGAGKAVVTKGQWRGATVVVGAYNPRGNMNRRAPY